MTEEAHSSTHPPLPPTTEDLWYSRLRLLRSRRIGPVNFRRLIGQYGSAQNVLDALPKMADAAGIAGYETCPAGKIDTEVKTAKAAKARLLCFDDPLYPNLLAALATAPPLLWAIGDLTLLRRPMIALVGARNASSLGIRMARNLSRDLGEAGYVVVSGLARGIDTAAHHAALETGTIAVMAGGCDRIYPTENTELGVEIATQGLRLSEQPMGLWPRARDFPRRNRIIAGLAQAVIVIEAAGRSGSLITARDALDLGREVLAVPGHPFDARAAGCNMLIRDGAPLVRNAEDVLAALPPMQHLTELQPTADTPSLPAQVDLPLLQMPPAPRSPAGPSNAEARQLLSSLPVPPPEKRNLQETNALHQQILNRLGTTPVPADLLMRDLNATPPQFGSALTDLELDGRIERLPGGLLTPGDGKRNGGP
ncbi:DNA processing protein DprA, putative [Roseobacter sp. SK209-2-6]|uniref:DNA-processing protein DprA n=1 Tax=Roseobacter sp. SK209-2-6 TaxID=388739 RepID=UPI0000F3C5D5|nr:DNA-processing protein DprA [Roseobacter sp. SK209-2-6]EBA18552.1 DNA processing protein DprA, putative [Roseobacter sp. SK209-2-6]